MGSTRCAVCKYFRRRCSSDCIFSPYFPANNPHRFACVHRIYGASNIGKMLEHLPTHVRAETVESLYYEAKCRIQDPVYGCVGIIFQLHHQIHTAQTQLARAQAEIAVLSANAVAEPELQAQYQPEPAYDHEATPTSFFIMPEQTNADDLSLSYDPSTPWVY